MKKSTKDLKGCKAKSRRDVYKRQVENISCSMEKIRQYKQNVTETLRKGIAGMLQKERVDVYTGMALSLIHI